jgi:hypothetical protein
MLITAPSIQIWREPCPDRHRSDIGAERRLRARRRRPGRWSPSVSRLLADFARSADYALRANGGISAMAERRISDSVPEDGLTSLTAASAVPR